MLPKKHFNSQYGILKKGKNIQADRLAYTVPSTVTDLDLSLLF